MKFKTLQRFKEKVKSGEYIDLDLCGPGDPRVFGSDGATCPDIQTQPEEARRPKKHKSFKRHVLVFRSGLKTIAKKAKGLVTCMSTRRALEPENAQPSAPVDCIREKDEPFAHREGLVPVYASNDKEEIVANDDSRAFVDQIREKEEGVPNAPYRIFDEPESPVEASGLSESVDCPPRRVKSKLPSEEARPPVEKGHVARVTKSLSSFDRSDNQNQTVTNAEKQVSEHPHLAVYSPLPLHVTSTPEVPEASSMEKADKFGSSCEESSEKEVQDKEIPYPEPLSLRILR